MGEVTLSKVLRLGLVADLVMDADEDDGDGGVPPLPDLPSSGWDAAWHLGRQLGVRVVADEAEAGDVESTLEFLVRLLDDAVTPWPPTLDEGRRCRDMAHEVTKNMSALEVFATLMAGPAEWRNTQVEACKVKNLAAHLKGPLERGLAAELNRMLGEWVRWEVPRLRDRHQELVDARRAEASGPRPPRRRLEGRERWDRIRPYRPPGRA